MQNRCVFLIQHTLFRLLLPMHMPLLWGHEGSSFPISQACPSGLWNNRARASLSCPRNLHWLFPISIPKGSQSAQNTTQKNIYWAFSLARFIWWEYFFVWDFGAGDMCTSTAQHIHSTLPWSTRLYYDTMKTVCTSPLMGPEPRRVNSDGCRLQSASDTWENSPLEEPLLWQRGSTSRNPWKIHKILRLHQNKFFLWYARPKLSLCPVLLKPSSASLFAASVSFCLQLFWCLYGLRHLHQSLLHVFP